MGGVELGKHCGLRVRRENQGFPFGIMVVVNLREEDGKAYLEIVVESYPYPVSYKGEYHLRSGSTKQELKGAALDKFLLRKQGKHWDGVPVPHVTVKDLSKGGHWEVLRVKNT